MFNTKTAVSIFSQLSTLVRSGDATTNPSTGPDAYDNLLGMGSGKYGMTIETSAALGAVTQLLGGGKYANVKLGVGAFPVYSSSVKGGIEPGRLGRLHLEQGPRPRPGGVVGVPVLPHEHAEPGHLGGRDGLHPRAQVLGADGDGPAPVGHHPGYKVAYNEVNSGVNTPATSGSVIGPYADVRTDVLNAEISMYTQGVTPAAAVKAAEQSVNSTISDYNSRLGAWRPGVGSAPTRARGAECDQGGRTTSGSAPRPTSTRPTRRPPPPCTRCRCSTPWSSG